MADPLTRGLDLLERLVVAVEQLAAQRDPKPDKRQRRAQRPRRRPLSRAELAVTCPHCLRRMWADSRGYPEVISADVLLANELLDVLDDLGIEIRRGVDGD